MFRNSLLRFSMRKIKASQKFIRKLSGQTKSKYTHPILINSLPKSGTHLLSQIVHPYATYDFHSFIASQPSFSIIPRNEEKIIKKLNALINGEIANAHIFYSDQLNSVLQDELHIKSLFIYRDLRAVAVSEAMYLTYMNKHHYMHKYFIKLSSDEERILLSIRGLKNSTVNYPSIKERFNLYSGWINANRNLSVTYENLMNSETRFSEIKKISEFMNTDEVKFDPDFLIKQINPEKSHTFRTGTDQWKKKFTPHLQEVFDETHQCN